MKKKLIALGCVLGFAPSLAFAQVTGTIVCGSTAAGTLQNIMCKIGDILNTLVPILVVLGIVYFVYGVITYVIASDEEGKAGGRTRMIYGIVGLVAIVAMWGLVNILITSFGLKTNTTATLPGLF